MVILDLTCDIGDPLSVVGIESPQQDAAVAERLVAEPW